MDSAGPENFYNEGFGWICRLCEARSDREVEEKRSRLMTEGEAENRSADLSTPALARWADRGAGILECPGCGTKERVKGS
ncbi:MAG: hypothetical protein IPM63_11185 [Acidobacteriota bacterium]|nr:MAG: hypothetical protein IPM63_11185 [Acidobacteriota bacterium]